jgi:hypothetical protein
MPLPELVAAEKLLSRFPGWSAPEPETGFIWFDAPIEIEGVTEAGLILHGGAYANLRDRHVVFELKGYIPGSSKRKALIRSEWRSIRGGHSNPRKSNLASAGQRVGDTHTHPFELNWSQTEQRLRKGNLRQAVNIDEELQSFETFRSYVGNHFGISNIGIVDRPPWVYDLFQGNDGHG